MLIDLGVFTAIVPWVLSFEKWHAQCAGSSKCSFDQISWRWSTSPCPWEWLHSIVEHLRLHPLLSIKLLKKLFKAAIDTVWAILQTTGLERSSYFWLLLKYLQLAEQECNQLILYVTGIMLNKPQWVEKPPRTDPEGICSSFLDKTSRILGVKILPIFFIDTPLPVHLVKRFHHLYRLWVFYSIASRCGHCLWRQLGMSSQWWNQENHEMGLLTMAWIYAKSCKKGQGAAPNLGAMISREITKEDNVKVAD